jgi:hypothetical protein
MRNIFNNQYIADNLLNSFSFRFEGDGKRAFISEILIDKTAHYAGREAQVQ